MRVDCLETVQEERLAAEEAARLAEEARREEELAAKKAQEAKLSSVVPLPNRQDIPA